MRMILKGVGLKSDFLTLVEQTLICSLKSKIRNLESKAQSLKSKVDNISNIFG